MKPADPRKAYNELARYFGLYSQSSFGAGESSQSAPKENLKSKFLSDIFGQAATFKTNAQLLESAKQLPDKPQEEFCAFTYGGKDFGNIGYDKFTPADQGWGVGRFEGVKSILDQSINPAPNVLAMQIFPVNVGLDVSDTEIASLFLNSLNTVSISQAVPYLDVKIVGTVPQGQDNFKSAPKMSLGRFLGVEDNSNDALLGRFNDRIDSSGRSGESLGIVGGMELFTTPQTLVDASDVSYSRETGGRIDAFRPFLSIESLTIQDSLSGAGTISYKTAELKLKLFDKGRLEEISEFVAPRRDPNVKFEITYGWSHPDGFNTGRYADADQRARIGKLIDAMRVTEIYSLANSGYTFGPDGTVDISLTLSMDTANKFFLKRLRMFDLATKSTSVTLDELNRDLEEIKIALLNSSNFGQGRVTLPTFVQAPDAFSLISMSDKQVTELQNFAKSLQTGKVSSDVKGAAAKLYAIFDNKSGKRAKLVTGRADQVSGFIKTLSKTPDPYLRSQTSPFGVKEDDFKKVPKGSQPIAKRGDAVGKDTKTKQSYVSYGKLMIAVLTKELSGPGQDLQFFFSSFNHSAAGVFDYNIAQFPIPLYGDGGLQDEMTEFLKKMGVVTIENFVRFVSEKFLTFDGSKAFGMSDIIVPQARLESGAPTLKEDAKKLADSTDPANPLKYQELRQKNLLNIYGEGKRYSPDFIKPRVNMRIVTKPAKDDSNASSKVVRVYFQDLAAGRLMTTAEMLTSIIREGIFEEKDYSSGRSKGKRTPKHESLYAGNIQKLIDLNYIEKVDDKLVSKIQEELKKKKIADKRIAEITKKAENYYVVKTPTGKIRKFFFENSPYLLHGTEGSGIIEASLNAEADDNLTSAYFAQRYSKKGDMPAAQQPTNLPYVVHPASLSIATFGCPMLALTQKYFVDFATNTTLDNYYVCTSVSHTISANEYKTSIEMNPYDAYGSYANVPDRIDSALIKTFVAGENPPRPKKKKKKKKK